MVKVLRGSLASHALVAGVAAGLSALVTWQSAVIVTPSAAQPAAAGIQQIVSQPLADVPGREVRMLLIERNPGTASPPHRHPGHHTFGYVMEGTYEFAIDRREPRLLKAGDTFYEPPGAVHSTSRNPSTDQRVKLLVFMVADQKNPTTVPE
jgi:quercetin dioxygenase-like cupin family protein